MTLRVEPVYRDMRKRSKQRKITIRKVSMDAGKAGTFTGTYFTMKAAVAQGSRTVEPYQFKAVPTFQARRMDKQEVLQKQ